MYAFAPMRRFRLTTLALTTVLVAGTASLTLAGASTASAGSTVSPRKHGANTWLPTNPMSTVRTGQTATLLLDGDVLVAGGGSATAELYDPTTQKLLPTGSMSVSRTNATATLLPDGDVLVAGGEIGDGKQTTSADLYDPGAGTFTPTAPMHTARSSATATLLNDGKVLVAGGGCNPGHGDCDAGAFLDTLRSAELYDPTSATWTKTASMAFGREYFTATLMPDGDVLVVGGLNNCDDDFCRDTKAVEVYDAASGTWSRTGAILKARERPDSDVAA